MKKLLLASVMSLAVVSAVNAQDMGAKDAGAKDMGAKADMEKCYGVVKAGKNDCAGAAHSCAGNEKKDGAGWVYMPKGLCDKLVGGTTTEKPAMPATPAVVEPKA